MKQTTVKISQLYLYPVKSFAGIAISEAKATSTGLEGDREWMVINENGTFVTQRQLAKMALIQPHYKEGDLYLSAPGMKNIRLNSTAANTARISVRVWKDNCFAFTAEENVNQWLNDFLAYKHPLRLVKFDSTHLRRSAQPERFKGSTTQFADAAPFLITNTASLEALNQTLESPVDMVRFRPNIVIEGLEPFAEHKLTALTASHLRFRMVDHCSRCAIITIEPTTGIRDRSAMPYKELAAINSMPNQPKVPAFGVNACLAENSVLAEEKLTIGQQLTWQ